MTSFDYSKNDISLVPSLYGYGILKYFSKSRDFFTNSEKIKLSPVVIQFIKQVVQNVLSLFKIDTALFKLRYGEQQLSSISHLLDKLDHHWTQFYFFTLGEKVSTL